MKKNQTRTICFFMKDAYPLFNPSATGVFGGAEVELYLLAKQFAHRKKYRVKFFVGDYCQPETEIIDDVEIVRLKYSNLEEYPQWYYKILRRIFIIKKLAFDSSDIFFTKTASDSLGYIVLINKLIKRKRVFFKLGSDIDADISYWKSHNKLVSFFYKLSLKFVDCIICQTKTQQNMLSQWIDKETHVIKNGFFITSPSEKKKRDYVLWVSRYDYMKRPELFLNLARALPQEQFLMIMPGHEKAEKDIMGQITTTDNLTFIKAVNFSEIQKYFEKAKCFVNTSEFEGFPNTFIQACLAATPILSFNVNPDNFIDTYSLGCFCRNSFQTAIDFVKGLDENKISSFGKNAFVYVSENHNIEEKVQDFERLIDTLINDCTRT